MKYILAIILIMICIPLVSSKPFIAYLNSQATAPSGLFGKIITRIWTNYFNKLSDWGIGLINISSYKNILDIGFGGGSNIRNIANKNHTVTIYGVDISKEALKNASKLNQQLIQKGKIHLSIGTASSLPFEDHFFDLITAVQTHIFWDELEKGLTECYRVLAQGGRLLITCEIDKIDYHLSKYQDSNIFKDLLSNIGFSNITIINKHNYIAFIAMK